MGLRSIFNQAGYVMSDNRPSGGLLVEDDVIACLHCQASISRRNWRAYGENRCFTCDGPMCSCCTFEYGSNGHVCNNFKMRVERMVEDKARSEQLSKVLGL